MSTGVTYEGQAYRFRGTFKTAAGTLTDPTTITFRIKNPAGTETAYTYALGQVTRESVGVYSLVVQLTDAGNWWCRVEGTGAVAAVDESKCIVVTASNFTTAAP